MKRAWKIALAGILIAAAGMFFPAWAAEPIARTSYGASSVTWSPNVENEGFVLTVLGPERYHSQQTFKSGETPAFEVVDAKGNQLPDGSYSWELRAVPVVSKDVRERLNEARAADGRGDEVELELWRAGQIPRADLVLSGSFTISRGSIVPENLEEGKARRRTGQKAGSTSGSGLTPTTAADQVIPDDLIVQQSLCVGFDCVNGESFGFDTIRLKENNTRIKFEDTSTGTFPSTDWQLTANDSASGGSNKFSIEDITGAKVPFTITAGASTNSIFVDSTGRVGFRTSTPVLDLHIATSNTPGIRLEQNSSGGFTAQTWDIAGNEANFFVRDVTSGSRLPFRIRPGAPTSSIDISADGDVGMGTASPAASLDVSRSAGALTTLARFANNSGIQVLYDRTDAGANDWQMSNFSATFQMSVPGSATPQFSLATNGNLTIGGTLSELSSREAKTNFEATDPVTVLQRLNEMPMSVWSYKSDSARHIGPVAEDFHEAFGLGENNKTIAPGDKAGVALVAIKGLNQLVAEKDAVISELQQTVDGLQQQNDALEARLAAIEKLIEAHEQ